jgi:hypothetical protein
MRRGFTESVTLPADPFLATAGDLFAGRPVRDVDLSALRAWMSWKRPGMLAARLSAGPSGDDQWPAGLFPEHAAGATVTYPTHADVLADLSGRAAGYGRRMAGVLVEPPPPCPP